MGFNRKSRTDNSLRNVGASFVSKILTLLLAFISRKVFIHYIGVRYLGINGLFSNVLTLLSLADLGLGTAMNVSLYKPIAEHDTEKVSSLLWFFRRIYFLIALAVTLIGLSLLPFLKYLVNLDQDIPHLKLYFIIFVLNNAVSYLFVYKAAILRADQKRYKVINVEIFVNISFTIIKIISVVLFSSYLLYIILGVVAVFVNNLIISALANREYTFIRSHKELSTGDKKTIAKDISSMFIYRLSYTLLNGTDNILISVMVGTIAVGLYSNYLVITANLIALVELLFTSLTPSIGNLVVTSSQSHRYKVFQSMQMVSYWLSGVITVCIFFLIQGFITIWLGSRYLLDELAVWAIALNTFFAMCMRPVWTFREGTGMYRKIKFVMLTTAMLNLGLSVLLGKFLGISGILFATSISKLLTYFWYEPKILYRDFFEKTVSQYYFSFFGNAALMLFCGGICYLALRLFQKTDILTWIVKAIICFAIVNVVYYIRYRKTEDFADMKHRIHSLFSKKKTKKKAAE